MASANKRNYPEEEPGGSGDVTSAKQQHLTATSSDSVARERAQTYLQQVLPTLNRMLDVSSSAKTTMDLKAAIQDGLKVSYTIPCCKESITCPSTYEVKEYIITTEDNGVLTPSAILGKLYENTIQRHKKHLRNLKKFEELEEQIDQVFNDLYYDGSRWQFKESLSPDEAEDFVNAESSLMESSLEDPFGYSPKEEGDLATFFKEALHPNVSMDNCTGRNSISELLSTIADIINLGNCINVRNVGGGAQSKFSVPFKDGYLDPDITWTHTGIKSRVILFQVEIKKGVKLGSSNRNQLKKQLIGSLLGQWQVFGLLISASEAEIYFAHRENSNLHLLLVNRYDLTENEQFKSLAMDILKSVTYQACTMVVDPFHLKKRNK